MTLDVYSSIPTLSNIGENYTNQYFCGSTKLYWADPSLNINSIEDFEKTYKATYCLRLPDGSVIELDSKEVKVTETVGNFAYSSYVTPYRNIFTINDTLYTEDNPKVASLANQYDAELDNLTIDKDTVFYRDVQQKQYYVHFIYYDSVEECWKGDICAYAAGEMPVPPEAAKNTPEMIGWKGYDNVTDENIYEIKPLSDNPEGYEYQYNTMGVDSQKPIKSYKEKDKSDLYKCIREHFDIRYDDGRLLRPNPDYTFTQTYIATYNDCNVTFNYGSAEDMRSYKATVPFGDDLYLPIDSYFIDSAGWLVGWDTDGDGLADAERSNSVLFPKVTKDGMVINGIYEQPEQTINLMTYNLDKDKYENYCSFKVKNNQDLTFNGSEVLLDGEKVILEGDIEDCFSKLIDDLAPEVKFVKWEMKTGSPYSWKDASDAKISNCVDQYYIRPCYEVTPTFTFIPAEGTKFTITSDSGNPEEVDRFTKTVTGIFVGSYSWQQDFDYTVFKGNENEITTFAGWDADDDGFVDYKYSDSIDIKTDHTFKAILETKPITLNVKITSPAELDFPESIKSLITTEEKDSEYTYVFEGVRSEYDEMMGYINSLSQNNKIDDETGHEYCYYFSTGYLKEQFYFVNEKPEKFSYYYDITIGKSVKGHTVTFNAGEGGYFLNNDNTQATSFTEELLNGTYNINDFTIYSSKFPRRDSEGDVCYVVDHWTDENGNVIENDEFTVSKTGRTLTAHWTYKLPVRLDDTGSGYGGFAVGSDYKSGISMWLSEGTHKYSDLIRPEQNVVSQSRYEVTGWRDSRDGEVHSLDEELTIKPGDANVVFSAQWEHTAAELSFSTYANFVEGTGQNLVPGHDFNFERKVMLPLGKYKVSDLPVLEDYANEMYTEHNTGWKDQAGNIYSLDVPNAVIELKDSSITLMPVFEDIELIVSFTANGGKFSNGSASYSEKLAIGKHSASELPVPIRENTEYEEYTFKGWNVYGYGIDGEEYLLSPGAEFDMKSTSYDLSAEWECKELKHHYEYSFDENQHWLVCINEGCTESAEPVKNNHSCDENGFCAECGYGYETPPLNNGTYEISSAAQLYGFAKLVNENNDSEAKFNAVLMCDITVNENVIDEAGNLVGNKLIGWTPIGNRDMPYSGVFDGQGYRISGLYYNDNSEEKDVGLFAAISDAEILNLIIDDSYFKSSPFSGNVGGIAGMAANSTFSAVENRASISGNGCGGICADADVCTFKNCLNTGKISGEILASGISRGESSIINCCNNGRMIVPVECEAYSIGSSNSIVHCFYNTDLCGLKSSEAVETREIYGKNDVQMRSGETAYLLSQGCTVSEGESEAELDGSVWGQKLGDGGDASPVLDSTKKVYQTVGCTNGYSNQQNEAKAHTDSDGNGVCDSCETVIDYSNHLLTLITSAKAIEQGKYSDLSFKALQDAVAEAEKLTSENTQEELNAAYKALESAIGNLKEAKTVLCVSSNPANSGILTGGGKYAVGETITMTARAVSGYKFLGWYLNNSKISTDITYEITVTGETPDAVNYVAKYVSNEQNNLSVTVGNGTVAYSCQYEEVTGTWSSDTEEQFAKGTDFTVKAIPSDGYTFLYWVNADGRILTESPEYSFYFGDNMKLQACYKPNTPDSHYVVFKDMNGKVLWSGDVSMNEENGAYLVEAPAHGTFAGYTFSNWKYSNGNAVSLTETGAVRITEDTVIYADYDAITGLKLTVNDVLQDETYAYASLVTVTAEEENGENFFSGWYSGDKLVSDSLEYSFYITDNTSLTAKYESTAAIAQNPLVNMTMSDRNTLKNGKQTVVMNVTWSVPEGYTFVEGGLVRSINESDVSADTLKLENADGTNVKKNVSKLTTAEGTYSYTLTLGAVSSQKNLYARGYITYKNDATGEVVTMYTDKFTSNAGN